MRTPYEVELETTRGTAQTVANLPDAIGGLALRPLGRDLLKLRDAMEQASLALRDIAEAAEASTDELGRPRVEIEGEDEGMIFLSVSIPGDGFVMALHGTCPALDLPRVAAALEAAGFDASAPRKRIEIEQGRT